MTEVPPAVDVRPWRGTGTEHSVEGMTLYDRLWTGCTALVVAASLVAAFHGFPLLVMLPMYLVSAMVSVLFVLPFLSSDGPWTKALTLAGASGGLLGWLLMGAGQLAGAPGLAVVVIVVLTSPLLGSRCRDLATKAGWRTRPSRRRPTTTPRVPAGGRSPLDGPPLGVPELLTDADLCRAWRSSFVALQRATSVESRLQVVRLRALYLDELQRRSGPAVQAWLESGARAASDPSRFLTGKHRGHGPQSLAE